MALDGIRIHWRVAAAKSPIRPGQIWTKAGKHICQVYLHVLLNYFGGRRGFHNKKSYPFLFVLNKVNVYNYIYNLKPTRRKKTKYKNYYYNYVSYKYISILRKNCNTCSLYHKLYTYWFADIKIESYMELVQYIRCSFQRTVPRTAVAFECK